MMINRILLDTSVYGKITEKEDGDKVLKTLRKREDIVIYGNNIIREELRNTPRKIMIKRRQLRMILLSLYDEIIKEHDLNINSLIESLAQKYFEEYKSAGGIQNWKDIKNDFLIVACASLNNLDIIVSEDKKTMASGYSVQAYTIVNNKKKIHVPKFIDYRVFKRLVCC